jgi:hypothetical protein
MHTPNGKSPVDHLSLSLQVPFRDSTLTKLLADCLRSAAQTTMLACVSPDSLQLEQTASTLHFANVVLRIQTRPQLRRDPHDQVALPLPFSSSQLHSQPRCCASTLHSQCCIADP